MNEQNLISFKDRSAEELREISRRGGIASGEARRRKRAAAELIKAEKLAQHKMYNELIAVIQKAYRICGI